MLNIGLTVGGIFVWVSGRFGLTFIVVELFPLFVMVVVVITILTYCACLKCHRFVFLCCCSCCKTFLVHAMMKTRYVKNCSHDPCCICH